MSSETQSRPEEWVRVEGESSFEDEEETLESLVKLKDIDFGDVFTNRSTSLDDDESDGISISFYHDENPNTLHLSAGTDNLLNIRFQLINSEEATDVLNYLLEHINPIELKNVMVSASFSRPFHTLDLPISPDTNYDIAGIRLRKNEGEYIIQEDDDDDKTRVNFFIEFSDQSVGAAVENDFINQYVTNISELIEEEL